MPQVLPMEEPGTDPPLGIVLPGQHPFGRNRRVPALEASEPGHPGSSGTESGCLWGKKLRVTSRLARMARIGLAQP